MSSNLLETSSFGWKYLRIKKCIADWHNNPKILWIHRGILSIRNKCTESNIERELCGAMDKISMSAATIYDTSMMIQTR